MPRKSSGSVRIFYPEFDQTEILQTLSERIKDLDASLPLIQVVLFGSYAKGKHTVGSDVDLLIVYRGEAQADAYGIVKKVLKIPRLEPHLYTEREYRKIKGTLDKMSEGGVVLLSRVEEG